MDNLYIIIPAYNEAENIKACVEEWYPVAASHNPNGGSRLVIIDDGSKDETYDILTKLSSDLPLLVPITKENSGHGSTVLYGFRYAIDHQADYIFQTDSDGQTDPKEFEQFWRERQQYDGVIGNRIVRGDGKSRKVVENVVCLLLRLFFGVKVQDANAPFRLMKTQLVEKYIHKLPADFNIPNIMFTAYFAYNHEKIKFIPITFKPRQGGVNSINVRKIIAVGWKALGDFRRLRREMDA